MTPTQHQDTASLEREEKQFIISESVLAGVLQYLYTRPYAEVVNGVASLQKLPLYQHVTTKGEEKNETNQ